MARRAGKQIRFSNSELDLVTRAAERDDTNFSDFVRNAALMRAARLLDAEEREAEFAVLAELADER